MAPRAPPCSSNPLTCCLVLLTSSVSPFQTWSVWKDSMGRGHWWPQGVGSVCGEWGVLRVGPGQKSVVLYTPLAFTLLNRLPLLLRACSPGPGQGTGILRHLVDGMAVISELKLTTSPMVPGHLPSFGALLPLPCLKCQRHVCCRALSPGSRNPVYRKNRAAGQAPELPAAWQMAALASEPAWGFSPKPPKDRPGVPTQWRPALPLPPR